MTREWGGILSRRAIKRETRKVCTGVELTFSRGRDAAYATRKPHNPYPAGLRRDAWEDGYRSADPWGLYHGRNE